MDSFFKNMLLNFRILIIYILVFVFIFVLGVSYVFAGVDLIEKKEGNFIVYYAKINKTLTKVFYIHKNYYSRNIIETLNYFNQGNISYKDIKYTYDDYSGVYNILLKNRKLVSINKDLAFLSGYYSKEALLNSYLNLLKKYIDLLPPVFFEKNYLLTIVNKDYYLKVIKKDDVGFNILTNENLEVNLISDNLFKVIPKKPGNYNLKLIVNKDNNIFEDEIIIDSKIPAFELPFNEYYISYSTDFNYLKKINWFNTLILPNIVYYKDTNLKYEYKFKNNSLKYYIFPEELNSNEGLINGIYYFSKEKVVLNFEHQKIYNPIDFDYLIISNNPEKISSEGILYENYLQEDANYFIWFHHLFLNNKNFILELSNECDNKININYYLDYSISNSEIQSGINASYSFFDFINNNRFINLSIRPKSRIFLVCENISKDNVLTGFIYLKAKKTLKIKIYTLNNKFEFNKELSYLISDSSPRFTGKFEKPFIQKELTFYVSNPFYSIRIPSKEEELKLASFNNDNKNNFNYSNYGVLYKVKINIVNNTLNKQKVFLYASSVSGYTPFVFLYKGNIYRVDSGMYKNLLTFYLEPNEEINESIYFLITPGLFYPIELELTTNKL